MANEQNLVGKGFDSRTTEEQREIARQGGKASAEARRKKRDLRLALEMLLERDWTDKSGNVISGTEAITAKLFEQAMKGNVKAFETLRDTVGQAPVQKIETTVVSDETRAEIEAFLNDEPTTEEVTPKTEG